MLNIQSMRQGASGFASTVLPQEKFSSPSSTSSSSNSTKLSNSRSGKRSRNQRKNAQQVADEVCKNETSTKSSELEIKGDIKSLLQQAEQQVKSQKMGIKGGSSSSSSNSNSIDDYCAQEKLSTTEAENLGKLLDEAAADLTMNQESIAQRRRRPLVEKSVTNDEESSVRRESDRGQQDNGGDLKCNEYSSAELNDDYLQSSNNKKKEDEKEKEEGQFKTQLVWTNIILFVILHSCVPISLYLLVTQRPYITMLYSLILVYASGIGITAGAHRLWSHRSYKAGLIVETFLMIFQTMAGQNSIYTWSRDHRVHHKFSETNADPHNIKRGFFFAHMGWLCCKKHPDVKEKGKLINMSDLEANKVVMFQHRHFWWLAIMFTVLIPTIIPVLIWNERFWTSFVISFMLRYLVLLHGTWLVNSAAHYYGTRPYDVNIEARESASVIYTGLGEGFHNYHHTFPYDYSTSEFGKYLNITTAFIDLCAFLGLVKDRRKVDSNTILKRRLRTGNLGENEMNELKEKYNLKEKNLAQIETQKTTTTTSLANKFQRFQKTIDEDDEFATDHASPETPLVPRQTNVGPLAPLSNIIHELPYISGLISMKFTM